MPTIRIDGHDYDVAEGRNLLQAALDHDLDLPYFCWHPALGSVGACRLCAVKQYADEDDDRGRIVMSCMTPAKDGARMSTADEEAASFRRSVIEWLMVNHPHDCPVCDEGGECHLQDMTVMTGHAHRRHRGRKRTYRNQYLGPLIHHDMNRCIQCYRCTRFYGDYAGGEDLGVFGQKNHVYFGRQEEGVLELPFAGNLVEVCPTGVFTDKTLRRHYARKWDLQTAPAVCVHCGLGCNTLPGALDSTLRRVTARYNDRVNRYWLCDRGRFGYEHANAADRLRRPLGRTSGEPGGSAGRSGEAVAARLPVHPSSSDRGAVPTGFEPVGWAAVAERMSRSVADAVRAGSLAGVASPRGSLEAAWALRRLVGAERFVTGIADDELRLLREAIRAFRSGPVRSPSLAEIETADAVLLLGCDPTHEAPLIDLALVRARKSWSADLTVVSPRRGRLDRFASRTLHRGPAGAAAFGRAVADAVAFSEAAVGEEALAELDEWLERYPNLDDEGDLEAVRETARALRDAERPLVVTGTGHRSPAVLDAALRVAVALSEAGAGATPWLSLAAAEANSLGLALLDDGAGLGIEGLVEEIEEGRVDTLVVCENDLFERTDEPNRLAAALDRLRALIVIDQFSTDTGRAARWMLPAAAATECNGTFVNLEGRAQRSFQVMRPEGDCRPAWAILRDLLVECPGGSRARAWETHEAVTRDLAVEREELAAIVDVAPPADFRAAAQRIPRLSPRFSGRNARRAILPTSRVHPRPPEDDETPLSFSMEGYEGEPPAPLLSRAWSPGWNSNEAINKFQIEVGGPLHGGDPGRRLLEPPSEPDPELLGEPPAPPRTADGELLLCATGEIFGSDPLTARAPAIAELTPEPYLVLNPYAADRLDLEEGRRGRFRFVVQDGGDSGVEDGGGPWHAELTVRLDASLPRHVAAVPFAFPETRWWQQPTAVRIELLDDGKENGDAEETGPVGSTGDDVQEAGRESRAPGPGHGAGGGDR